MKKLIFLIMGAAVLTACSKKLTPMELVAQGEPIYPIHVTGDTTRLYLTDYVPAVEELISKGQFVGEELRFLAEEDGQMVFVGQPQVVEVLSLSDGTNNIDIPVLPNLPVQQGLTTLAATDTTVTIGGFGCCMRHINLESFVQNIRVPEEAYSGECGKITIHLDRAAQVKGRSYLRVYAGNTDHIYNDILVPLEDGKPVRDAAQITRHDPNGQILYSLMVDRFYNGLPDNDQPLNQPDVLPIVDYMGGDIVGITKKIEEGFFDELGINTIWVSPLSQNPKTAWGFWPDPATKFSGYHGYWPIFNNKLDDRFGQPDELRQMLATAHEHHINVILDYVANHMHIESPTLQEHPDWITDSIIEINGEKVRNFELWDDARLTTWFDKHIPSLDLEREEVCQAMTDTALYWVENYDFDGYRHDACKHIPLNYWRMFTKKMKTRLPDRSLWMIGETYGDAALISSYVKTGMLNAQFDFNIYHTAIDVFGKEGESMERLAKVIDESCNTYGYHHTMGNISGNHDKTRFISLAGGAVRWDENDKVAGWTRKIDVTADGDPVKEARAFKKALLLEVVNLTIPGVPCIYQGDEYGQCGANDPDNRRMMRFDGLNDNEQAFRQAVVELTKMRRHSMPLMYGDYKLICCDKEVLAFSRTYLGETIYVVINNAEESKDVTINEQTVTVEANGYKIF